MAVGNFEHSNIEFHSSRCAKLQQSKINFRRFINSRSSLSFGFGNVRCLHLTPNRNTERRTANVICTRSSHLLSAVICALPCNVICTKHRLTIGFSQTKRKLLIKGALHHHHNKCQPHHEQSLLLIIYYFHFSAFCSPFLNDIQFSISPRKIAIFEISIERVARVANESENRPIRISKQTKKK